MEEIVEKLFSHYDSDKDGFVEFSDFAKILSKLEVELLANYPIQRNFATFDINKFPGYDLNELIAYIKNSQKYESLRQECSDFFTKLDEDKDGLVCTDQLRNNPTYALIFKQYSKSEANLEEFTNILIERLFQTIIDKH